MVDFVSKGGKFASGGGTLGSTESKYTRTKGRGEYHHP